MIGNTKSSTKKDKKENSFNKLMNCIIQAMLDKKAKDVTTIDLRSYYGRMSDMFIICHGTSDKHVEAIAKGIEEMTHKKIKTVPGQKEGFENKEWILLDYFDIIVHVFTEEKRYFYSLENLWGDGEIKTYEESNKSI